VTLADVVCLTEPRVIDALFDRAGAILSADPDLDAPRHQRPQGRSIPFAVIAPTTMFALNDAHPVAVSDDKATSRMH